MMEAADTSESLDVIKLFDWLEIGERFVHCFLQESYALYFLGCLLFHCVQQCYSFMFQLFVQSNQGDEEMTRITYFTFIGTPVQATNMNDFKRVGSYLSFRVESRLLSVLKTAIAVLPGL